MKINTLKSFYEHRTNANNTIGTEIGHFNIVEVESLKVPNKDEPKYNRRSYFKISYVEGKSQINYINKRIAIDGPTLVFTNPVSPYDWETDGEPQTGYVCIFTADYLAHFIDLQQCLLFSTEVNSVVPLSEITIPLIKDIFLRMRLELGSDYRFKHDLIRHMLLEVIHYAQKEISPFAGIEKQHSAYERIYLRFAALLNDQFSGKTVKNGDIKKSPAFFASEIGIHINHLNKALQAITGQSTTKLIQKRTLEEAMFLLKSSKLSVKEIAWKLGFEQANHFSVFFKRNIHQAPHVFRTAGSD